ncbi:MAG: hypothetical protein JWL60_2320 [Gemmatimonadetes bacterium]|jgi:hypothetical protein|nr:hypothetical protein [Gemmatimonadota bacterium]
MITSPGHAAPMYASATATHDVPPSRLARDTIYMPSSVAARLLGTVMRVERPTDDVTTPPQHGH